ncbi:MAG: hypothetical protein P1U40_10035 [Coxiellaceae bacterium]|nr:hypothetical protein [Coxiellaceae bacterium]
MPCKFESSEAYLKAEQLAKPLYTAVAANDIAQARRLVAQGARMDYKLTGNDCLMVVAIKNGLPDMLRFICEECGCSPQNVDFYDFSDSPLMQSVIFALSEQKAEVSPARYELHKACMGVLIEHGASVKEKSHLRDESALDMAAEDGELVGYLKNVADEFAKDYLVVAHYADAVVTRFFNSMFKPPEADESLDIESVGDSTTGLTVKTP